MGEGSDQHELGPVVREKTLALSLKVLEQRLTIKLIGGLLATQALAHFSIPSTVTVGVVVALAAKLSFLR